MIKAMISNAIQPVIANMIGNEIGGAGVTRPAPALFWSTAYSPDNFSLVLANQASAWKGLEETTGTDLTQGTSGNQPVLVEDNTVTQFTASNQPTFAKDKQVAQDTLSSMPTYDATEGALAWNGSQWMDGLQPRTGNFSYRFIKPTLTSISSSLSSPTDGLTRFVIRSTDILVYSVSGTVYIFSNPVGFVCDQVIVTFDGTNLRVFINNSESPTGTLNATGEEFLFTRLGRGSSSITGTFEGFEIYDEVIADPANIVESPSFTLDGSDPSTMLTDSDAQPSNGDSVRLWHDPSAVDVMAFDDSDSLGVFQKTTGDWVLEIDFATHAYGHSIIGSNTASHYIIQSSTETQLRWSGTVFRFFDAYTYGDRIKIKLVKEGDDLTIFRDGVFGETKTGASAGTFDYEKIGQGSTGGGSENLHSFKQWNSADSSGTPDFTLTADPTKMRTSANVNPVLGEGVAKWYADEWSGYRDNHVLFDPVKYMEGLPAQAGDFTYIFKYQDDDQATAGAIVSSNIDASGIFNVDGDTTDLRADDATNYLFDNTGATSYRMVAYLKSGDDVYNVTDYVFSATQDATGKAFNLTSLGKATSGKDMKVKEFGVYGSALSGNDLDYFFYERDVNTGEIILVDGQPQLPVKAFGVNSIDLDGTSQYLELQGATSRLDVGTDTLSVSGWGFADSANRTTLYNKGQYVNSGDKSIRVDIPADNRPVIIYLERGASTAFQSYRADTPISDGFHHMAVYDARTSQSSEPSMYIDGVFIDATWENINNYDRTGVNFTMPQPYISGRVTVGGGSFTYNEASIFTGVAIGQELTQADVTYLYNEGTPLCWQDVATDNPTLFAKFDMTVDNGTYNGRTELQALTDHTNGWVFSNVNNAPFTNQGLTVECSE